jgi:hypothetical protein
VGLTSSVSATLRLIGIYSVNGLKNTRQTSPRGDIRLNSIIPLDLRAKPSEVLLN